MPDIYQELLTRALATYRSGGNGFHPDRNAQDILSALSGLDQPFGTLAAAIARQKAGGYTNADAYATASREALLLINAQRKVLAAAVATAAISDRAKIARVATLDMAAAAAKSTTQKAADAALLVAVDGVIQQASSDATAAASSSTTASAPAGGTPSTLPSLVPSAPSDGAAVVTPSPPSAAAAPVASSGTVAAPPIDLDALTAWIESSRSPAEDREIAAKMARLSGRANPERGQ